MHHREKMKHCELTLRKEPRYEVIILRLHYYLLLPVIAAQSQTDLPGEWKAALSASGKLEFGMNRVSQWYIFLLIILLCFAAL